MLKNKENIMLIVKLIGNIRKNKLKSIEKENQLNQELEKIEKHIKKDKATQSNIWANPNLSKEEILTSSFLYAKI